MKKSGLIIIMAALLFMSSCATNLPPEPAAESSPEPPVVIDEVSHEQPSEIVDAQPTLTAEQAAIEDIKNSLMGFWHNAPDFSNGLGEAYLFSGAYSSDGGYYNYYKDEDSKFYNSEWDINDAFVEEGYWDMNDTDNLELGFYDELKREFAMQSYNFEYIPADEATGYPSIVINNQKFWKMNMPLAMVNHVPLYLDADFGFEIDDYKSKEAIRYVSSHDFFNIEVAFNIILYCDADLYDFKICSMYYDFDGTSDEDYFNSIMFSLDKLTPEHYIEYTTVLPPGVLPIEGITFKDSNGKTYTYIIYGNRRDGSTCAYQDQDIGFK